MNIWRISVQNIKSKPLNTLLSILLLSLSIALLLAAQKLKLSFQYQMEKNLGTIDLVIGAKGSPLQLVLSSVLHIDNPTGNIPYEEVKRMAVNPLIKMAVPISYGDNYKGFRILGTSKEFMHFYNAKIQEGRLVQKSMEVVLGQSVAEQLQLTIGDTFVSAHGLVANEIDLHDEELIIVGILAPTQKVIDRLIITNLESIWEIHNHEVHKEHKEEKEITSLLISFRSPAALLSIPRIINRKTNFQAALPKYELDKLSQYTGVGLQTISRIAYIMLIIAGMNIFISLFKMIKERAFDLALLRTYGASTVQLIKTVIYEGLIILCFAIIIGLILSEAGLFFLFNFLEDTPYQSMLQELLFYEILEIFGLVFMVVIVSVSLAMYPIIKMNISTILSNEK